MKFRKLVLASMAVIATVLGAPAQASDFSLTVDGVTFEATVVSTTSTYGVMDFSILNALSVSTGTWKDAVWLDSFSIGNIGNVTGGSVLSGPAATFVDGGLNASGCNGNGDGGCFDFAPLALTDNMSWQLSFSGTGLNLYGKSAGDGDSSFFDDTGVVGPHVKVAFQDLLYTKTGDLLSVNIPTAVPEPEIYAMLGAGLALMGWVGRRRKLQAA